MDWRIHCPLQHTAILTPRVGLEPTTSNLQSTDNKEVTEKANPVFATGLAKIVQKYPELEQIITAWPGLSQQVKNTIKKLIMENKNARD
jgi:hypothetical protein